jgi:hypothetical protein
MVELIVSGLWTNDYTLSSNRHWAIGWQVGTDGSGNPVYRILTVVWERPLGFLRCLKRSHFTNRGPETRVAYAREHATYLPLGMLDYAQRQALERIATVEVIQEPLDGTSRPCQCHAWVLSILNKCVEGQLLNRGTVGAILRWAREEPCKVIR